MKIDHIAIWTNDLEAVKDFYLKYFNCTANDKYENPEKQFSSYFLSFSSGSRIELMNQENIMAERNNNVIGISHVAINVGSKKDVDALTNRLENDGFVIESYPRTTGDGYYESVILDLEDNRIEIVSNKEYY